jgi:hypothetical protein
MSAAETPEERAERLRKALVGATATLHVVVASLDHKDVDCGNEASVLMDVIARVESVWDELDGAEVQPMRRTRTLAETPQEWNLADETGGNA